MLTGRRKKNAGLEGRIIPVNIEQQMKSAYIDYSMSVIVRAPCLTRATV